MKRVAKWLMKAYIVWSVCADIILLRTTLWHLGFGAWLVVTIRVRQVGGP